MKIKLSVLFSTLLIGSSIFVAGVASAATVTWQGGDADWFGSANWLVGAAADQDIPDQTTSDDDIFINGGTVSYNPGSDFGQGWGATSVTVSNGATLTQSTTHWANWNSTGTLAINAGSTLSLGANWLQINGAVNVDGSTLTAKGVRLGSDDSIYTAALTLANGSTFSSEGVEFWFGSANSEGTYTAGLSIDSTSSLTLTGGGGASLFLWGTTTANYSIDFVGDGGSLTVGAAGIEINNDNIKLSFEDLWDMGVLTHNGGQIGEFTENFALSGAMGSDGYTVTAIAPPPQGPPVWSADPITGVDGIFDEDYSDTLAGKAYDPNGDDITYALVGAQGWLFVAGDGELTGTPDTVGTNVFTVSATDLTGSGVSTNTTLEIVVLTQDPPVWSEDPIDGGDAVPGRDYAGTVNGKATDPNGDEITYSLVGAQGWLYVAADGTLTGTPLPEDDGLNTFEIGATDINGSGLTSTTMLEIDVVTPPPVDLTAWSALASGLTGNVTASDNDGAGWYFDGSGGYSYDFGELDSNSITNGSTIEFIFNLSDAASSQILGTMVSSDTQNIALKLEQWPNTGTFGITLPGVWDYSLTTASMFNQNVHVVFVRTSEGAMDMYVNGALAETNIDRIWRMDGGSGWLGSGVGGTGDVPAGTIYAVASYDLPLGAGSVAALYDAYINGGSPAEPVVIAIAGPFAGGTEMTVSWTGAALTTYSVETNSNLVVTDGWNELEGGITGAEGQLHTVTNIITGAGKTFYRVLSE